ncbi:MAG: hypothetical protein AAGH76_11030 [Pseudomonadota bacterium]
MESIIRGLLAQQDPNSRHTLLTRLVVSVIILFANAVLYGFYGVVAAIITYLFGVAWLGMPLFWMFVPFYCMLLYSVWHSIEMLLDYWRNYGHG